MWSSRVYLKTFSLFITASMLLACAITFVYSIKHHYFTHSLYYTALIVLRDVLTVCLAAAILFSLVLVLVNFLLSKVGRWDQVRLHTILFLLLIVLFLTLLGVYFINTMDILPPLLSVRGFVLNVLFTCLAIVLLVTLFLMRDRIKFYLSTGSSVFSVTNIACFVILLFILSLNLTITHLRKSNRLDFPSILLISLDTLRSDHLGCYGYDTPTSPYIDAFAGEAILFRNAFSQSSWTLPAHMSLFTSQYPIEHGSTDRKLTQNIRHGSGVMLAEILRNYFYTAAAYTGGGFLGGHFGFQQGFDIYSDTPLDYRDLYDRRSLEFIEKNRTSPFFLFLHTYCVHNYHTNHEFMNMFDSACTGNLHEWEDIRSFIYLYQFAELGVEDEIEVQHLVKVYDASIRFVDSQLGTLFEKLKELGLYDQMMIIITSDHGEEFGEHQHTSHGHTLYNELIQIPLIIKFPHGKYGGIKIDEPVMLIDIMPTVLDYVGIKILPWIKGKSLIPSFEEGVQKERPAFSELKTDIYSFSMRTSRYHLIYDTLEKGLAGGKEGRFALYNVVIDPGESIDVSEKDAELFLSLKQTLLGWLRMKKGDTQAKHDQADMDSQLEKDLEALGYIQ